MWSPVDPMWSPVDPMWSPVFETSYSRALRATTQGRPYAVDLIITIKTIHAFAWAGLNPGIAQDRAVCYNHIWKNILY